MKRVLSLLAIILLFTSFPCNILEGSDWKYYSESNIQADFYDADNITPKYLGIYQVWTKSINKDILLMSLKKNISIISHQVIEKMNNGYFPPYIIKASAEISEDAIRGIVIEEVTANYPDSKPIGMMLLEINCLERIERPLSITLYREDGTRPTKETPGDWKHIRPDTSGDDLRKIICAKP